MVIKPSPAVYLSEDLQNLLKDLDPSHKFNKWVADMKLTLKGNMLAGDSIPKQQIPAYYVQHYGVNNLYRYDHPEGFRSCYALLKYDELGVCPQVLDLLTHAQYDKRFKYKTR